MPAIMQDVRARTEPYVSLFWRLFVPNATVLGVACLILWVEPANGRLPVLIGGLAAMLAVNLLLMRRAFSPLLRLATVMNRVDPLAPGRRIDVRGPRSEVAVLTEAFNDMLDRLELERRDSARRALAAQQEERRRLSRELHDEIGQSLTALTLQLDRAAETAPPPLRDEMTAARGASAALIEEVRTLAQTLRPDVLDNVGLAAALRSLCERFAAQTGLRIRPQIGNDLPSLDPDTELVVYRIAQEALTNAARHAQATEATLLVERAPDGGIRIVVRDDGTGIDDAAFRSGSGIRFMRERAVLVGGRLDIGRAPSGGTAVELHIPRRELA